jgi:hypothetical protein
MDRTAARRDVKRAACTAVRRRRARGAVVGLLALGLLGAVAPAGAQTPGLTLLLTPSPR